MTDTTTGRGLSYYQGLVADAIRQLDFPKEPHALYEPVRYMMALGGKRVRPVLSLLSCELFGGQAEDALMPALAMEVFHNFTLVHDDIMDNAHLRRGQETVHARWDMPTAILSGDVMLVLAYDLLAKIEPALFLPAVHLFNDTARKVCEGQQLDMIFEKNAQVGLEDYIQMIGLKTAALLAGCLKLGALIAHAPAAEAELMYEFGYKIGTAFQIQDDLLDSYGNEKFGKAIGGDIAANKKTYLTLKAFELADAATREELSQLYSSQDMEAAEKIRRVMAIYNKLHIKTEAEFARDYYFNRSMMCLDAIQAPEDKKMILRRLAEDLVSREK